MGYTVYKFNLKDAKLVLSIPFMGYPTNLNSITSNVLISFNSLYGILNYRIRECMILFIVFQFPLWDTPNPSPLTNSPPYFQFPLWDTSCFKMCAHAYKLSFNSLYGIHYFTIILIFLQHFSFNSLYGIHSMKALSTSREFVDFQFPLWDTKSHRIVKRMSFLSFNSLYGILN